MPTIGEAINNSAQTLRNAGCPSPRLDSEILLADALATGRIGLYLDFERPLSSTEQQELKSRLGRRQRGEPIAYIIGEKEFMGLTLRVNPSVLVPRPETEGLVESFEQRLSGDERVLDIGTGSGAIALALACRHPVMELAGWDISEDALTTARANAKNHGVRIRFELADITAPATWPSSTPFDAIISNPPYIPSKQWDLLESAIKDYEPRDALDGGETGLKYYAAIIKATPQLLKEGGLIAFEVGFDQAERVSRGLSAAGFTEIAIEQDLAGHDRMVFATWSPQKLSMRSPGR